MNRWVALLLFLARPASAGTSVESLAVAALAQPETLEGGLLIGPPESRATWYFLGALRPFDGDAMAVFSTGSLDEPAVPGADLSAVGAADDVAGLTMVLRAPEWAHSLRYALRMVSSAQGDPDEIRVLIQGDVQGIDPDSGSSLRTTTSLLDPRSAGALEGSLWAPDAHATPWVEGMLEVPPGQQIQWSVSIADGPDAAFDSAVLVDGVRWDRAEPGPVRPGVLPWLELPVAVAVDPACPEPTVLSGRDLQVGTFHVEDEAGEPTAVVVNAPSSSRLTLAWQGVGPGVYDLVWGDGESALRWRALFEVDPAAPSLLQVTPAVVPAGGGTLLRLEGVGLSEVRSVSVGELELGVWTARSCAAIEVIAPPDLRGAVDVSVGTAVGATTLSGVLRYAAPEEGPTPEPDPQILGGECAYAGASVGSWAPLLLWTMSRLRLRRR